MRALFDHAVIVFAFVGMAVWAFGVHWDALVAAILSVGAYGYMAHRRGRLAREAMGVLVSDRF